MKFKSHANITFILSFCCTFHIKQKSSIPKFKTDTESVTQFANSFRITYNCRALLKLELTLKHNNTETNVANNNNNFRIKHSIKQ